MSKPTTDDLTLDAATKFLLEYAADEKNLQPVLDRIGPLLRKLTFEPTFQNAFRLLEQHGVHLTPVHFYQPIPDTRTLTDEFFARESAMAGIEMNEKRQLEFVKKVFPEFRIEYDAFPLEPTGVPYDYYFGNDMFSGTDALVLYCMVRHFQPQRIVEVGSGFSSRLSAKALRTNGFGKLTCIEPYPNETLRAGFPGLSALIPEAVQDVAVETFQSLVANDILFVDSSHVVKIGGDVNYIFFEVLPRLAPGVLVHVHDIFFPMRGRRDWVMEKLRFWTEQDLLQAFLMFNSGFEVLFSCSYLQHKHPGALRAAFPNSPWWGGGSFWMRRKPADPAN
jgi:hypothetical protein